MIPGARQRRDTLSAHTSNVAACANTSCMARDIGVRVNRALKWKHVVCAGCSISHDYLGKSRSDVMLCATGIAVRDFRKSSNLI